MKKLMVVLSIIIVMAVLYFLIKNFFKPSNNQGISDQAATAPSRKKEDINWNNIVDQTDASIVRASLGCQKTDSCWNKVIGKTVTGDNPIYTFDLDMNSDGVIDQIDVDLIK